MATRRRYASGADSVLMSEEDYNRVQKYKQDWQDATAAGNQAGAQAAHDAAEALRAKYSYSGGTDGSEYNPWGDSRDKQWQSSSASRPKRTDSIEPFTYESAPTYTNKYQDQIDELLGEILNRPAFEYDPETDPRYGAYKKEYAREGQRATADTMGQMAAMTGGMPSTAAVTASQQAGDYYAAQMADKIPELYQLAYAMYQDEGDSMRLNMDMLTALEQGDYNKYLHLLDQYNTQRSLPYGVYSDDWDRNYQLDRDDVSDSRYDLEWNYGVNQDRNSQNAERAALLAAAGDFSGYAELWGLTPEQTQTLVDEYARERNLDEQQAAMDLASFYAQYGDFSRLREMGVDTSYLSQMQRAELADLYSGGSGGSSGGSRSGSGSSGGSGKPRLTYAQTLQAIEDGRITDSVISAYDYYMGDGAYEAAFGDDGGSGDDENLEIDMNSVINLGYGPINEQTLSDLEDRGEIESYVENGLIKFRRSNSTNTVPLSDRLNILGGLLGG